jgi:hypothetical protein
VAQSPPNGADSTGLFMRGAYMGLRDQTPREKTYGDRTVVYNGCDLGLRTDGGAEAIGFPDRPTAEAFVSGWQLGELHAGAVRPLHGVSAAGPWLLWNSADARPVATGGFEVPGS